MEIFKQLDSASAAAEAGEYLNTFLVENKKSPVLLLLSGGSALSITNYVGQTTLGANLTVSMLDDRYSQDGGINNFLQMQKTEFYQDVLAAEAGFFGTLPRPLETMEDLRQRWDKNLKTWRENNPLGLIIATLGMGPDGHTAGILPFPEDPEKFRSLFDGPDWTAAYNAGDKNPYPERITTTLTFLKLIDFSFAFVAGKEKQEMFNRLTSGEGKQAEHPAMVWREMKNVKIFTDLT
ncbi:MAG: 6-phosphogluconolactonase [Candidatus Doudnabacteria bacterium]|nr:6-phosphogluconolactonase [Candidatus Doudnabacteria bacterium]